MVWLQKTFYFQAFIAAFMFSGTLFKGDHNKRWDRARWVMHNIFWLLVLKERVFFSRRLTWSDNIDKKSFVIRGVVGYVSWIHLYRDEVNDISSSINHAKFSYQLPRIYSAPSSWLEIPKKKSVRFCCYLQRSEFRFFWYDLIRGLLFYHGTL